MTKKLVIFRQEGVSNVRKQDILSQNGINTVLLMLFVIMTGSPPPDILIYLSGLI